MFDYERSHVNISITNWGRVKFVFPKWGRPIRTSALKKGSERDTTHWQLKGTRTLEWRRSFRNKMSIFWHVLHQSKHTIINSVNFCTTNMVISFISIYKWNPWTRKALRYYRKSDKNHPTLLPDEGSCYFPISPKDHQWTGYQLEFLKVV